MKTARHFRTAAAAFAALLTLASAHAATITVDSFADDNAGCTLRKAMANALAAGAANAECAAGGINNTVLLAAGTYRVTGGRIPLDGPTTTSTTVLGLGPAQTVVDGTGSSVIFDNCQQVGGTLELTLKGMTLTGGRNSSDGGAICVNFGTTLTVDATAFTGNFTNGYGGAIFSQASHNTVIDSSFESNRSIRGGGAIWGRDSTNISGSYFGENDGGSSAGALYLWNDGAVNTIDRSTFWGNRASYGSVFQGGSANTLELTSSTVIGNVSLAGTGTYWVNGGGGTFRFTNTIIAGNTNSDASPGGDCDFISLRSNGYSILGDNDGCGLSISGPGFHFVGPVTIATVPAYNGGPTKTIVAPDPPLLMAGRGNCGPDGGVDQRGVPRPLACTIGAYELDAATPATAPSIIATAAAADGFIDVAITPGDGGGRTITGHRVECGAASTTTVGTSVSLGPLQPGVEVACRAFTLTNLGDGDPSADVLVTPLGRPEPPVIGTAVPGIGSVLVNYTAPANSGGLPVFLYSATCGGISFARVNGAINVTGLANGVPVTCTVTATNARGTSAPSAPSNLVTPGTVPDAPTAISASAAGNIVTVGFTPGFDGGLPILGFRTVCNPGNHVSAPTPAAPASVSVGADGSYSCVVIATNSAGDSGPSAAASVLVDATAPAVTSSTRVGAASVAAVTAQQFTVTFSEPVTGVGAGDFALLGSGGASGTVTGVSGSGDTYVVTVSIGAGGGTLRLDVASNGSIVDGVGNTLAAAFTAGQLYTVVPPSRIFSGPSPTGTGTITASFTGGGAGCGFDTARFIPLEGDPRSPPAGSAPAGVSFPHGLFDFTTTNCDAGGTITMTVDYPRAASGPLAYYKYGPTPSDAAPHWYVMPSTQNGATFTFSITDGGLGDDDLAANGDIVDQGGPGGLPPGLIAVPTMSQWMLVLLALLMAGMAMTAGRARRR